MKMLLSVDCTHIARAVIMWLSSMLLKVNSSYTADKGMGYEIRESRLPLLAMLVRRPYPNLLCPLQTHETQMPSETLDLAILVAAQ